MDNNVIDNFRKEMDAIGLTVSDRQAEQFSLYYDMLIDWNTRINLTRITEPDAVCRLHFIDSTAPMRFISFEDLSLIDIGTGAGFPGIPLKIMNPSLKLTLLDALDKRCRFLQGVTDRLELTDVSVVHGRAEDAASAKSSDGLRGSFDIATSRAVAKINILCEYAVPFLKTGGRFIAYKSLDEQNIELNDASNAMSVLGAVCERQEEYLLPETEPSRTLYFIKKISDTPDKYPRRAGMPEKKPL